MLNLYIGVIVVPIKYVRVPRYNPDCLLLQEDPKDVVLLLRCVLFCSLFFTGNGFSQLETHVATTFVVVDSTYERTTSTFST
jgi:hypothetical protein